MSRSTGIWICNILVAMLSVLAIVGYFFAPFWKIDIAYNLHAEELEYLLGPSTENMDFEKIVGEDGYPVNLSINIGTTQLFSAFGGNADKAVGDLIESNVDSLIEQFDDLLREITPEVIKSETKSTVKDELNKNVQDFLSSLNPEYADKSAEEIEQKLKDAGVDDAYIEEKTGKIIDAIFDGDGKNVEEVTEEILDVMDEVYEKLSSSDDEDFKGLQFTEEARAALRGDIERLLFLLADENGNISADDLLDRLLQSFFGTMSAEPQGVALTAAKPTDVSINYSRALKLYIMNQISPETVQAIAYVMMGMCVLLLLSWLAWAYILIKLLVKLITRGNPAVKLKAPIWLGWLPFLILVCLPTLAVWLAKGPLNGFVADFVSAEIMNIINTAGFAFLSSGWIALAAACALFVISIVYMVLRKKN